MPWATWTLIALNVAAFALQMAGTEKELERAFAELGLISGEWRWFQFLTSSFMHGDWMHLLGNVLFLWVFGDNVEDVLGTLGFLFVYLIGGLVGDVLFVYANDFQIPSIGASGCIAAVAGAYGVLFYGRDLSIKVIFLVFPIFTFSAGVFWVLLYWFGLDVARTLWGGGELAGNGGVNYVAHGAGFAFGLLVGVLARLHGTMRRYETLSDGSAWWGYWPMDLEEKARRAEARRLQAERREFVRRSKL